MASDVTKLRISRGGAYPGLTRWALNTITCILITEAEGDLQPDRRGGDVKVEERNLATSQRLPGGHQELGEARNEFSPRASNTLICKRIKFSS